MTTLEELQKAHKRRCELEAKARQTLDKMYEYKLDELLTDMLDKETKIEAIIEHALLVDLEEWANERKE